MLWELGLCCRLTEVPKGDTLPPTYSLIKTFPLCVPCDKVIKYSGSMSTLEKHLHTKSCKYTLAQIVEITNPNEIKKRRRSENINSSPMKQHNWALN